ncbi:DNA polymerase theta-like, helix-turn-helix domain [Dillenia turbinata]|uniref:DNA polymerase theta-like, helix-turn-helix domain n=1 Tax=Dillenia turbinata TaxID=194707 RepID=A0AAN8Z5N6_9MAGN
MAQDVVYTEWVVWFFASRKKKITSPGLKSQRIEINSKSKAEGSPSAKGTLDSYLVPSQDNNCPAGSAYTDDGSSIRQDLVKRNLSWEIDLTSKHKDKQAVQLIQADPLSHQSCGEAQKITFQVGNVVVEDTTHDSSVSANGAGSSELKQFAADFLSLYCRHVISSQQKLHEILSKIIAVALDFILIFDVSANVSSLPETKLNACKRNGSPTLLAVEDNMTKRRHFVTNKDQHQLSGADCVSTRDPVLVQSDLLLQNREVNSINAREVPVGNDLLHASLRKCSKTPNSAVKCHTPGSLIMQSRSHDTPRSNGGSSIFSPGESFWNEAIQVVDGLFSQTDNCVSRPFDELNMANSQFETGASLNKRDGNCNGKSEVMTHEDKSSIQLMEVTASTGTVERSARVSVKDVSPLPVKHFDFSCEDKNLDGNSSYGCPLSDKNGVTPAAVQSSVNKKTLQNLCAEAHQYAGSHEVQDTSLQVVSKGKVALLNHGISPNTLDQEFRSSLNHQYSIEPSTPSSFVPLEDCLDISNWLPSEICSIYQKRGITKLYRWQVDCLKVDGVLQNKNLVYCASTSAGKSFVAEILMLRRVISTGKMALLVLPYVSICTEKAEHLEMLLEPLGKHVRSYYGNQGGGTLPKDTSVAVCTIEKANSLINRLLEEGRLLEVGIVVIDELHMVGDQSRGYLLELLLTKLRYAAGEGNAESLSGESSGASSGKVEPAHGLQIVGMSATMPNVAAVADWLHAALYQTDFRPVPLEEFIKVGNTIYDKNMKAVRTIQKVANLGGKDPDHIVHLCNEVVQEGHSVLLFCSSRKGCESTARHVAKFLEKFSASDSSDLSEFGDIASAIDALQRSPAGLDPTLGETLPCGVAYHHAGLTVEEREIVESCYRKGLVRVLTATSTLAAGVNLPARRVIFRQPRIGRDFIDGTRYRQMAGRAGRTGIDTKGESVLICKPEEIKRITSLLNDSCPPLYSCLSEDKNGMTHAILEVVAGGIVQTANDIHRYVRCTLLNSTKPFEDVVTSAQDSLRWLCHQKFLEWNEETKLYSATPLGRAAFGSSLCPEESLVVLDDLIRAREGFVLASDLHLVYLATPINVDVEPDWDLYYERFMKLSLLEKSVGNRVGVEEPFLMRMAHGAPMRSSKKFRDNPKRLHGRSDGAMGKSSDLSNEQTLRVCKRFYVALILARLVQEAPVSEVCEAYKVARGMVQALQENAGRFASMVSVFCERLGWHDLEGLLAKFQNRVSFGVRAEIVELTTIPYVKGSRARALYKAGLRTAQAIAEASIPEIAKALFESSSWAAQESAAQRRIQLGMVKKIKNGARKIVLDKAEEARVAAFSAFRSLGVDIPQLDQPLLPTAAVNCSNKEAKNASSGEESISNLENQKHVSGLPAAVEIESPDVSASEIDRIQAPVLNIGLSTSADVKVAGEMVHCSVPRDAEAVKNTVVDLVDTKNLTHAVQSRNTCHGRRISNVYPHNECHIREKSCLSNMDSVYAKGPVNAHALPGGFDAFLNLWDFAEEFYFDAHFNQLSGTNSLVNFEMQGIAICWANSPVYYVNIPKDLLWSDNSKSMSSSMMGSSAEMNNYVSENQLEIAKGRWSRICYIMEKGNVRKFSWNLKLQLKVLKKPLISVSRIGNMSCAVKYVGTQVDSSYVMLSPVYVKNGIDMCIVAWILWPDEERSSIPNLEKEAKKRLPSEASAAANRSGQWKNQMRRAAHNGCCRRVAQTRALGSTLWRLVVSEELVEELLNIEVPLVNVLADMEEWGIGVDMEGCLQARHILWKKLKCLEKEAYSLAGMKFSLSTSAEIANVLYGCLRLPVPEARNKGKLHPSTDKHCLDLLKHHHPIVPIIKEHRTLAKLLNCTLGSMCSMAKLSVATQRYTLHGRWLQTSTATGRLSMEEPNLQCVEHMIEFTMHDEDTNEDNANTNHFKVNARDFFIPTQENWLLLTADYSQIELRLMAHFSKDSLLIELLSKPNGDVFNMIAARWTGKLESDVDPNERDQTKRLVYGILYGMGPNTLAEQLECSSDEAAQKIQSFKSSFPGVASWLHEAVASCREKGYIKTLKGRKRFLSKIKLGDNKEKSRAQRQAVNSICQGSAADIIKIAMLNIYSVIVGAEVPTLGATFAEQFCRLKGHCRILLQVHDELVLEADPSCIKEAGILLQRSMESAVSLLVPLHVKLKIGKTWGALKPFVPQDYKDSYDGNLM